MGGNSSRTTLRCPCHISFKISKLLTHKISLLIIPSVVIHFEQGFSFSSVFLVLYLYRFNFWLRLFILIITWHCGTGCWFIFFFGGLYPSSQILYAHRIWNLNRIGLHNKMKWIMRFHWARLYTPLSRIWNLPIPPRMRLGIYFFKWFFSILLHVHTAHLQPTVAWWTTSTHTILSVKAKSPFPVWMTAKKWGWLT